MYHEILKIRRMHLHARHKHFRAEEDLPDLCGVLQVHVRAFTPTCRTKKLQLLLGDRDSVPCGCVAVTAHVWGCGWVHARNTLTEEQAETTQHLSKKNRLCGMMPHIFRLLLQNARRSRAHSVIRDQRHAQRLLATGPRKCAEGCRQPSFP